MNIYPLAQVDSMLSLTGVIATILAVIFALGAFFNSRNRRKHMEELEKAQKHEQLMQFRPAASHHPGRSSRPGHSSRPHASSSPASSSTARIPPVAKAAADSPKKSDRPEKTGKRDTSKQVLFRQVRPDGVEQREAEPEDGGEQLYVWE